VVTDAQALYDLTVAMDRTMDVRERVEIFVWKARELLDFDRVGVFLTTPDALELEMVAGTDLDPRSVPAVAFWEQGGGFQVVWETAQTVVVSSDAELAALPPPPAEVCEHPFSRSRRFVIVPLRFQGRPIGAVGADNKPSRRPFTPEAVARLELFCQQLAASVNTARVFAESERRRRAAEALADVGAVLAQTLDPEVVAQRIADDILAFLEARSSAVYRLDPGSADLVAIAVSGAVGPTFGKHVVLPRGTGLEAIAVRESRPMVTPDILHDPQVVLTPEARARIEMTDDRAVLALPLMVKDRSIGALGVGDRMGRRFRSDEIALAQALANQAALALESAALYAETQRREREATVLFDLVRRLATTLDLDEVLDIVTENTREVLACDAVGIYRRDEARGGLASVRGRHREPADAGDAVLTSGEGVGGRAYSERRAVWSREELAVPIIVRDEVFGVLMATHRAPQEDCAREVELLSNLAAQAAVAIENATLYAAEATARAVAEAATGAKSRFLASMSHELRTPLNSVIGFANVLLKNRAQNLREQDLVFLGRIADNGKHLLGLINDILDLSKVEAGRIDLLIAPQALDELVTETLHELESQVRERDVRLTSDLPSPMAPVSTDRARLKQVLINLVGNALKFTERGSVTVRVAVEPETRQPYRIDVVDTGIGISREKLGIVFEAFQQADSTTARRFGGTGLGLAISRSLAQQLGYHLTVESEIGHGSTFSLHLGPLRTGPRSQARADASPTASPARA
jgi:signal transduction histidine kinase